MRKDDCKLKKPVVITAKNAEVYLGGYESVYVNDVSMNKILSRVLGNGTHHVSISISITPQDPVDTLIKYGDEPEEQISLDEFVKEEDDEPTKEDTEADPEE